MTASPSTTSVATQADQILLEDLFMHVTARSHHVVDAWQAANDILERDARPESLALTRTDLVHLSDAMIALKSATSDVCARVAVALVRRTEILRQLHVPAGSVDTSDLTQQQLDEFVRPIFEESGIGEDFMPWGENPERARP